MIENQFGDYQMLSLLSQSVEKENFSTINNPHLAKVDRIKKEKSESYFKSSTLSYTQEDPPIFSNNDVDVERFLMGKNLHSDSNSFKNFNTVEKKNNLPAVLQDAIIAIAEYTHVSEHLILQSMLSVLSGLAQAVVDIPHSFFKRGEPCSLYLLTLAPDRNKKIFEMMKFLTIPPLLDMEKKPNFSNDLSKTLVLKEATVSEIVKRLGSFPNVLAENRYSEYVFGKHTNLVGITSKVKVLKSMFDDGGEATEFRTGRLTLDLMIDNKVIDQMLTKNNKILNDFFACFLFAGESNIVGNTEATVDESGQNYSQDPRLVRYWEQCEKLSRRAASICYKDSSDARKVLKMSHQANQVERDLILRLREEYENTAVFPFLDRVDSLLKRVASIFTYFQEIDEIDEIAIQGAGEVVESSLKSWCKHLNEIQKNKKYTDILIHWLRKKAQEKQIRKFEYSYLQTSAPRPLQKDRLLLEVALQQLELEKNLKIEYHGKKRFVVLQEYE